MYLVVDGKLESAYVIFDESDTLVEKNMLDDDFDMDIIRSQVSSEKQNHKHSC